MRHAHFILTHNARAAYALLVWMLCSLCTSTAAIADTDAPSRPRPHDLHPSSVPTPTEIDGRSVVPILRGEATQIYDDAFGYFRDFQRMIRGDRWKLIHYPQIDRWQLFDVANDPHELKDLADDPASAKVKRDLQTRLHQWQQQVGDPLVSK